MMMMLNILFLPVTQAWVEFHNWPAYPRDLVVIIKVFRFRLKLWTIYNAKKGKILLFYSMVPSEKSQVSLLCILHTKIEKKQSLMLINTERQQCIFWFWILLVINFRQIIWFRNIMQEFCQLVKTAAHLNSWSYNVTSIRLTGQSIRICISYWFTK